MTESISALDQIVGGALSGATHRPWHCFIADEEMWRDATMALAEHRLGLLGLWGDTSCVCMALLDEPAGKLAVMSLDCADRSFPSVAQHHPPALRLERAICDLFGFRAVGLPDTRPWLDHGLWQVAHPLGEARPHQPQPITYDFLPAEGEGLHRIPVGPVHAGIIEPGHFRFNANGETVVRLEERLGYTHKGTEALMKGATIDHAARLAGRVSGDSTVAYAWAFAAAVEAAVGASPPPRALWLRALMAELERLANHIGDIGAICNDAAFALMLAHCAVLRERVLRASSLAFGHRLMMDRIAPGGVAIDPPASAFAAISQLIDTIDAAFPQLVVLYDNTASLQDRTVGTGRVQAALARQYAAGGFIGRASGRAFDARRNLAYGPYDRLQFEVPVLDDGDVNARVWIRIREVEQSLRMIRQIVAAMPAGAARAEIEKPVHACEGLAVVEGFRGDILVYVRIDGDGSIARCHLRDPSWFQWPLLEAAIEGNIVADFPLCNKSFNCSYSGHDL